ncbi:MAG: glutamate-5-semialdehyde dehydrogenase [Chthoniobacter sp.]|nr:glutamate-5-semialdehyde dehydrogenase [Chthoniobacter sp.]
MTLSEQILDCGKRARVAARQLRLCTTEQKNAGIRAMADELLAAESAILAANAQDLEKAKANGLSGAMLERLKLDPKRLAAMADGVRQVADLPDPVGEIIRDWTRPNGLHIEKKRVPIGVIGIIYESRPNVTSDAAVLCLKTGNATILRGGSESIASNVAIAAALSRGCARAGLPADAILLIPVTDREAVRILCGMDQFLDCIVPRGGKGLIETVVEHARMPVIKHYDGICAMYVDKAADLAMAESLILNAKCQRPGVCNAIETVLVHSAVLEKFATTTGRALLKNGVQLRCDDLALAALSPLAASDSALRTPHSALIVPAKPEDYRTEFLDLILAIKTVDSLDEAIAHIEANGSHHSDCIITADEAAATHFLAEVDSATVYWNASTRFTDGGEFGFGAEIGISTDKLHARGPMGLEELTTYKYLLRGNGQIRG